MRACYETILRTGACKVARVAFVAVGPGAFGSPLVNWTRKWIPPWPSITFATTSWPRRHCGASCARCSRCRQGRSARRASLLYFVRYPGRGGPALAPHARAISRGNDGRAAAPVLGSWWSPKMASRSAFPSEAFRSAWLCRSRRSKDSSILRCSSACNSKSRSSRPRTTHAQENASGSNPPAGAKEYPPGHAAVPASAEADPAASPDEGKGNPAGGGEVVRLDRFRKK